MTTPKYNLKLKLLVDAGNALHLNVKQQCILVVANKTYNIMWPIFENHIAHSIKEELNER
jgi:ABC-type amino acid transport system permease subunit